MYASGMCSRNQMYRNSSPLPCADHYARDARLEEGLVDDGKFVKRDTYVVAGRFPSSTMVQIFRPLAGRVDLKPDISTSLPGWGDYPQSLPLLWINGHPLWNGDRMSI
uniref:Uncharacterized protein n=1 Tax=Leptocylindrus danicus TaxID=163516 RepID=A0A7S2KMB1_9STRA